MLKNFKDYLYEVSSLKESLDNPLYTKKSLENLVANSGGFILDTKGLEGKNKTDFYYAKNVDDLYKFALNCDNESFRCWYIVIKDKKVYTYSDSFSLFGDFSREDMYDDNGRLKQEVKDDAIKDIKKAFKL